MEKMSSPLRVLYVSHNGIEPRNTNSGTLCYIVMQNYGIHALIGRLMNWYQLAPSICMSAIFYTGWVQIFRDLPH